MCVCYCCCCLFYCFKKEEEEKRKKNLPVNLGCMRNPQMQHVETCHKEFVLCHNTLNCTKAGLKKLAHREWLVTGSYSFVKLAHREWLVIGSYSFVKLAHREWLVIGSYSFVKLAHREWLVIGSYSFVKLAHREWLVIGSYSFVKRRGPPQNEGKADKKSCSQCSFDGLGHRVRWVRG